MAGISIGRKSCALHVSGWDLGGTKKRRFLWFHVFLITLTYCSYKSSSFWCVRFSLVIRCSINRKWRSDCGRRRVYWLPDRQNNRPESPLSFLSTPLSDLFPNQLSLSRPKWPSGFSSLWFQGFSLYWDSSPCSSWYPSDPSIRSVWAGYQWICKLQTAPTGTSRSHIL